MGKRRKSHSGAEPRKGISMRLRFAPLSWQRVCQNPGKEARKRNQGGTAKHFFVPEAGKASGTFIFRKVRKMRKIQIADTTLCRENGKFSFRERLEVIRLLDRLGVDVIEIPAVTEGRTDILLVRTASAFVRNAVLSVGAGADLAGIERAAEALSAGARPMIRIELPISPVGMEYTCHKKPQKMLSWIAEAVAAARKKCQTVEFCALDATRAEPEFLREAIHSAEESGATSITVCDNAGVLMPDETASFIGSVSAMTSLPVGIYCEDRYGIAAACAMMGVRAGAACVKTAVGGKTVPLDGFASLIRDCGSRQGLSVDIRSTELHRAVRQIVWVTDGGRGENTTDVHVSDGAEPSLDASADADTVAAAVARLGYDLSAEDSARVYEEFGRVAAKKPVGTRELEAIVASTALQVPDAYRLTSYVINNGNIIASSAQITLERYGKVLRGICLGDGPVDAAFRAIEQIVGHRYELDDFQIQAVTEGKEAVGSALVRLHANGKLYSGNGVSTDIIGASIRAYLGVLNKIVYEEAEA